MSRDHTNHERTLRCPNESDVAFRVQVERACRIARVLIKAALANRCIQQFIADPSLPYTEESVRQSPDVRVEYDEAIAFGDIGSCLSATRSKHWGDGPYILPLEIDDPVDPVFVLYEYRPTSRSHRRFNQRRRLKQLLGKRYRALVGRAQQRTKKLFLDNLERHEKLAIQRILKVDAGEFWRAVRGRLWIDLPPELVQLLFNFGE
ncbi:MAG: hypothetical protein IH991_00575 [Planctomycetes bacterium]|nr:hypothetical protein [Planctomycetota bacterium]